MRLLPQLNLVGLPIAVASAGDFFWSAHGREQFPKIAEQVEVELNKYKQVRVCGAHRGMLGV